MNEAPQNPLPAASRSSPLWTRALLVVAAGLMALGLVWGSPKAEPAPGGVARAMPGGAMGFGADSGTAPSAGESEVASGVTSSSGSSLPFRLGFSFAVAYAFAYAARIFFNFTIAAAGFVVAALVGLQYAGFVEVKWIASGEKFDHFHEWAMSLVSSAETMVKGVLPSASSAAVGLFAGWRRR